MKKSKSLRLAKDKSKGEKPQKISKDLKKMQEWEKKKKRQSQKPSYNYFTKDLHTICEDGKLCPRFVEKCIEFVEEFGELLLHRVY